MSEMRDQELHRMIADTAKLNEETRKFVAEQHKLMTEGDKLRTEAAKLDRERVWFPWLQLLTVAISSAAIGAVVAKLFH
jgi:hypothetical protein